MKCAVLDHWLHFHLDTSLEVDFHRDKRAKSQRYQKAESTQALRKLLKGCLLLKKKKKKACLVSPLLYPAGFSLKTKLQQTFWKSYLCKKTRLSPPEKPLSQPRFRCQSAQVFGYTQLIHPILLTSFSLPSSPHP